MANSIKTAAGIFVMLLLCGNTPCQEDSLNRAPLLNTQSVNTTLDSSTGFAPVDTQQVSLTPDSKSSPTQADSLEPKEATLNDGLINIAVGNKKVRAYGWGEYRVKGRCLCCDNTNDGDCIVVHNIERTDRDRITKIIDGNIEADTANVETYFGNLQQREHPDPVTFLMVDISLGKLYEIKKVIVYTLLDKQNCTNYLPNCELGYYDQFTRLQWMGRIERVKLDQPMTFELENPIFTKSIMLRIKGGKSRITEVAILCEKQPNEKQ